MSMPIRTVSGASRPADDLAETLQRIANGDRSAFADLYRAAAPKLLGVILRICRERDVAEDVLQDVLLNVWKRARQFDPERARPMTWLIAIARNRAIDRIRSQGAQGRLAPIEAADHVRDEQLGADARLLQASDRARIHGCLDELEARHSAALRTAFFEGMTYEALAEREGVPAGTMKSWIRRSLIRMKECLER